MYILQEIIAFAHYDRQALFELRKMPILQFHNTS